MGCLLWIHTFSAAAFWIIAREHDGLSVRGLYREAYDEFGAIRAVFAIPIVVIIVVMGLAMMPMPPEAKIDDALDGGRS